MSSAKREQINYVLECFKSMNANKDDLAKEKTKLQDNEEYLHDWLETTEFVPGKKPWVWGFLRRFGL